MQQVAPTVYMIPCLLGETSPVDVLPLQVVETIKKLVPEINISELNIQPLNKHTPDEELAELLIPLEKGKSIGVISEAGMPGIADPGARLASAAHDRGFNVVPLVGPSSIFLALAASGFNGQSFSFHGYLPIDKRGRRQVLKDLENKSRKHKSAEIFMETPYRNNKFLDDIFHTLSPDTKLCVACDVTLPTEFIRSAYIKDWSSAKVDLHKRPAIFILQAD